MQRSFLGHMTRLLRTARGIRTAARAIALVAVAAIAAGTVTEAAAQAEFRINTGGGTFADYTDVNGDLFVADKAYVAGDFGYVGGIVKTFTGAVGGTTDDLLYQMIRGGASFSYTFDNVPDGTYDITLYFTDPLQTSAGLRLFDVTVEGVVLLDDFDIVAVSGGQNMATAQTVTTDVADGQLNISFAASASIALVSAIAVVGQNPPEPVADVSVSPTSLDFGDVVTGETGDLTVTVSNIGTADLDVTGLTTTNAAFAVTGPAVPVTLAAGTSTDVTVQFAPTALGTETGDLEIASTDPDEPLVAVSLTGTGVDVVAGATFRINAGGSDFTTGSGDLYVADKAYTAGDFGWTSTATTLFRTFTGAVAGTTDDLLYQAIRGGSNISYLFDNVPAGTYDISLHFMEPLQTAAGLRLFDVTVEGNVVLDDFDIFGTAGGQYIANTQVVTATVSDGQLNIDMTASSSIVLISAIAVVTNTGTDPTPDIAAAPGSLNFGTVQTGTSGSRQLSVSNVGSGELTVTGLSTTNADFAVVSPATPFMIAAGGAPVAVTLDFNPTAAGTATGDLEITSDDPDEALTVVALTGDATDDPVALAYRVNAGGTTDYVDDNGHVFFADQAYSAGSFGYVGGTAQTTGGDVGATIDDALYLSNRIGTSFGYQFDNLPAGDYELRLYWMDPTVADPDVREFDVTVEGMLAFNNVDLAYLAGTPSPGGGGVGAMRAYSEGYIVTVVDGSLNVDFAIAIGSNAIVSAIAVREAPAAPLADFEDVAADVGIIFPIVVDPAEPPPAVITTGAGWADYDNDGDLDLYATNHGGPNRLYENQGDMNGDGLPDFVDMAAAAGVDDATGFSQSAVFIDYDNDGDQDLYVTDWGANKLFQNQLAQSGSATFTDVTATAGLADDGRGMTTAWADFDQDGFLDVYVTKHFIEMGMGPSEDHLYHNNGDGTFTDWTGYLCPGDVAPCAQTSGLGFSAVWYDYDNDADLDLYLVNDDIDGAWYPNVLWRNDGADGLGGWIFQDVSFGSMANLSVNSMGLGLGDFNNDGFMDLAFSNISPNNLLRHDGVDTYTDVSATAGIQRSFEQSSQTNQWSWGTMFLDADNDGWLDLLYVAGHMTDENPTQVPAFMQNNGDGTFTDRSATSGFLAGRHRHASLVDFDGDGFPDLFMPNAADAGMGPYTTGGVPRLYRNRGLELGNTNHWLTITVEGTVSNRDGIGTRLTITTPDGVSQIRDINSGPTAGGGDHRAAYFGLGDNTTATLSIRWPTGVVQDLGTVSADQVLSFVEPSS